MGFTQEQIEAVRAHAKSIEMKQFGWNAGDPDRYHSGNFQTMSLASVYVPRRDDSSKIAIAWTIKLNYDKIDCQWYIGDKSYNDSWTYDQFMSLDIIDIATIEKQLFDANEFDAEVRKRLKALAPEFKKDLRIIRDDPL